MIKQIWRFCCCTLFFMLMMNEQSGAQDPLKLYTVKNGKMHIVLSKTLPEPELDSFIAQFDLYHLALKRFINSGYADSIKINGWEIGFDTRIGFMISKPLISSDDINDPAGRIIFTGDKPPPDDMFPTVSNTVTFGFNRFRNKRAFATRDSVVTFFLRNNLTASRVGLAGSFNNWDPDALSMVKTDSGWISTVKLAPGKHWYKFIVDGNWTIDTDNKNSENDGQGNTNSVFYFTNSLFSLKGFPNAKKVFVTGSFNNWEEKELLMVKTGAGWELPVYLAEGTHTYRFIVDGDWMADPGNPLRFPNEHGDFNSAITIGNPHIFKLAGYAGAANVILSGSFNGWRDNELSMMKTATGWELPYVLGPGNYEYKFIVDGKSIADPVNPSHSSNQTTSYLVLEPNYVFHLKGYENAKTVFLAGDFNQWSPNSLAMKKENGEWVFAVHLSMGKHLYKFIVDGEWIIDPANKLWENNEHNTGNSVLWIGK